MRNKKDVLKSLKEIEKKAKSIREKIEKGEVESGQTHRAISYIRNRVSALDGLVWRNE